MLSVFKCYLLTTYYCVSGCVYVCVGVGGGGEGGKVGGGEGEGSIIFLMK